MNKKENHQNGKIDIGKVMRNSKTRLQPEQNVTEQRRQRGKYNACL